MGTYQGHISKFTPSIEVNGENKIEVSVTFTNKQSGYYENELYIELGNAHFYKYFTSTSAQTISFVIPVGWLSEIPDSPIGTGRIRLCCVNMNTAEYEYEETKSFTVYVPEEYKPTISDLSVVMRYGNEPVNYAVYGLTRPEVKAMVSHHPTSPIKKWYIKGGGIDVSGVFSYSTGYEGYNFLEYGTVVKTFSNTKFTVTVEDGRGRTASITSEEFYVLPYNRPIVNSLSAYRVDEDGLTKADGGYIKVTVDGAISPIRDSDGTEVNILACYLDWKTANGDYTNFTKITNKEPFIFEADIEQHFEIKCVLRDAFMETIAYCNVVGNQNDFNIADGGGGAAIGTKAQKGYFDVAHDTRLQKSLSAEKEITSNEGFVSTGTGSKGDFLSFGEATSIAAYVTPGGFAYGDDFNDYTDIGLYGVFSKDVIAPAPAYGGKILNIPVDKPGTLRVYNATGDVAWYATEKHIMQEYVVYDGSAVYRRCLSKVRDTSEVEWPSEWTFGEWQCYTSEVSGTSGDWTYIKRSDGIAECWATISGTGNAVGMNTMVINFPLYFLNGQFTVTATPAQNGSVVSWYGECNGAGNEQRGSGYTYFSYRLTSSYIPRFNIHAIGRWK